MAADDSFLGTGWAFPPTFRKMTDTVDMLSDEDDVKNSLEVLLSTEIGERIMQPTFGCNLSRMLFEPVDTTMQAYVYNLVNTAVLYYEPRIDIEALTLEPKIEEGVILIHLEYRVRSTNSRHNIVYPYYIEEGTNIKS